MIQIRRNVFETNSSSSHSISIRSDALMKELGEDIYFDELLERIREIRASERRAYQKITDVFEQGIISFKQVGNNVY